MEIKLPDPDTHCLDDDFHPPRNVWSYSPELVRQIIEADRAQREEPVAWMREWDGDVSDLGNYLIVTDKDETKDGYQWEPLYTAPQPAHTEAEVQEVLGSALREFGVFEQTVRSILNVEKP